MIDTVTIDTDEGEFTLELCGDLTDEIARYEAGQDCVLRINIHHVACELLAQARKEIGPWAATMEEARREFDTLRAVQDERECLDADDPKHPDYRERLADIGDQRRKRLREVQS